MYPTRSVSGLNVCEQPATWQLGHTFPHIELDWLTSFFVDFARRIRRQVAYKVRETSFWQRLDTISMTVKAHFHTIGGEMQEEEITIKLSYKYLIDKDYRSNVFEMQLKQRDESVFVRCTGLGPQGPFEWRDHVDTFTEYDRPVYI